MAAHDWDDCVSLLRMRGISFDPGLTDDEIAVVESRFSFRFPPDLHAFLQVALPHGRCFPDWRTEDAAMISDWLDRPRQGVIFDITNNGFWLDEWGPLPATLDEARKLVDPLLATAPKLIPIYMHRMLPSEPHLAGNPVFSVHQTDIIVYGTDLRDYLNHEFLMTEDEKEAWTVPAATRAIPFWDTERFQEVRWGPDGSCRFDNSRGTLPQ